MKLYVGGVFQGQDQLARSENPDADIFYDFHETIRNWEDPRKMAEDFCKANSDAIIVANEVGAGVVPIEKSERLYREKVGRALCVIAAHSEKVVRVVCGIGMVLKGSAE